MIKFYRVKKDTFLWKAGAILTDKGKGEYSALEDAWDAVPTVDQEYITAKVIEHPDNAQFFERVYKDSLAGTLYRTKDQVLEMYDKAFR